MKPLRIVRNEIPLAMKVVGIALLLMVPGLLIFRFHIVCTETVALAGICILIAVFVWTLKGFIIIDFKKGIILEGHQIFGLRLSATRSHFTGVEKIYVNYIGGGLMTYSDDDDVQPYAPIYKAFLKTLEGDKFCIAQYRNKDRVMGRVKDLNKILNVEVYDNSITVRDEFYEE
ncbi:MAG TPA: hypothetical protein VFE50_02895 [Cyclobacteriaceae bacterium]|nr:hypothetical protein [Cyclobacteriaceae bacterium]